MNKASVNGAIGAGLMTITLCIYVRALLNGYPAEHGMKQNGLILTMLFAAFTTYALLTNQEYASCLAMGLCAYGAISAVFGCAFPVVSTMLRGIDEKDIDTRYLHVLRMYCWSLLALCAMTWALLTGVEPNESLAYASVVVLAGLISQNFFTKDTTKLEMKRFPQYAWMTGLAVLAGSILLPL